MSLTIKEYMINLIAGRSIIGNLYNAVINARRICAKGGSFSYTFSLDGFGQKRYKACELIQLDEQALCESLMNIFFNINELSKIDQIVVILLKGKTEIRNLYGSFYRAENAISNAKILCYTFTNPYEDFILLNKNRIRLSEDQVIELFNNSQNILFNPDLIANL